MKIIYDYEFFISKIKGLRLCLDELLTQTVFNKFEKYNDDFIIKIRSIFDEVDKKADIELSPHKFKEFMYNNTPEGRVIIQNTGAIEFLKDVKIAELCIKNIKTQFIKSKSILQKNITPNLEDYEDEEYLVEVEDDNESTGSLSE